MRRWIFFIILFLTLDSFSQVLKTSMPFSTATPYIESDGRKLALKLNENDFVLLSKTKGHLAGESGYQLEKYDKELTTKFKTPINCVQEEEFKELISNGKEILLFSTLIDLASKKSYLQVHIFDIETGVKKETKILFERTVLEWMDIPAKATVKSTFENEISNSLSKHFTTPFEYQYHLNFSPDNSKLLAYAYDFGQKNLIADTKLFDATMTQMHHSSIPIDNGFINYGIYPNNKEDIYILNSERTGRIVAIQLNLKTKGNKLLDIQNASTNRTSLTLSVFNDQEIYIACINTIGNKLAGVMYAKFDFIQKTVEKLNFHDISMGIQQTADIMRSSNKYVPGNETWSNFEITHFHVNEYEKIILVLEKHELAGVDYVYNKLAVYSPKNVGEKTVKVNTEGVLLFCFNKDDELLWENYYLKSQVNDIGFGITTSSFSFDITDDGRLRMYYPSYETNNGLYHIINYIEWDELTGSKTKEMKAPNEQGISMITPYTLWWPDRVLIAGRKGILGKKSFLYLYKLEVN